MSSETPPAVLVERLARARREGVPFGAAWPGALDHALTATHNSTERLHWATVLGGMVPTWRAAFNREPVASSAEAALSMLTADDRTPMPEHPCARCGTEIPAARLRRHARWCSDACRRAATDEAATERREAQRDCVAV
jgi:hypothetical protein